MTNIKENLISVHQQICAAEQKYHRPPHSVTLLAVSKGHSVEKISAALNCGQFAFGENYLQEALTKISELQHPAIEWHYLGSIQSNKTKKIAAHFHWVHTISDVNIAERLHRQRPSHLPALNICLQVNSSLETSKSGIAAEQLFKLAQQCSHFSRLKLRGLMAIPAAKKNFAEQRLECQKVQVLWENLREKGIKIDTLSLGMSNDLEAAIAEGCTMVRIGTKIFGDRK